MPTGADSFSVAGTRLRQARKTLRPSAGRFGRERGQALPMVLGMMLVFGIAVAAVSITVSSTQSRTKRDVSRERAFALAEAGLNNALALLYNSADPANSSAITGGSTPLNGGTAAWSGTLSGSTWSLTGTGSVSSPVAGGGTVSRTISLKVNVSTAGSPWSYFFSSSTSGCMSLKKDAVIAAPLYVRGNLCVGKDGIISGAPLEVDGNLSLSSGATVGSPGSPVDAAHLVGGCDGHACTAADGVYATTLDTVSQNLAKPAVDLAGWYAQAKPGPANACTTGSVPGGFDNDGNGPNGSRTAFDLMPAFSYDCQVTDGSGNVIGRFSWTPGAPGTLVVAGTIFIDGPLAIPMDGNGVYSGRATIYASGTVSWGKDSRLCGVATCDTAWNSNTNLLMLVAGSSSTNAYTMDKNATFQGMSYAVGGFSAKKDVDHWGPIIAEDLDFEKDAAFHPFPTTLPPGSPGVNGQLSPLGGSWRG
jgi:Tfp pilus assembly protein PilX